MQAPGFWDNQDNARKTSAAHATASRRLEGFEKLQADAADLDGAGRDGRRGRGDGA